MWIQLRDVLLDAWVTKIQTYYILIRQQCKQTRMFLNLRNNKITKKWNLFNNFCRVTHDSKNRSLSIEILEDSLILRSKESFVKTKLFLLPMIFGKVYESV